MNFQTLPWVWSFEPTVWVGCLLGALLYAYGVRYMRRAGLIRRVNWLRCVSFFGGLAVIIIALESPIDAWSETYLTMHMAQHLLLLFAAPPLLLFGAPLPPIWRVAPVSARRASLRWALTHPRPRRVLTGASALISSPRWVWFIFVVNFLAWHSPALYNLTLENQAVHDLEHILFLATGLLLWAQIIPSAPLRPRLGFGAQALYLLGVGMSMEFVSMILLYDPQPLYTAYLSAGRSAAALVVDQTTTGGLMDLTSVIVIGTAFMVLLWRWLGDSSEAHGEAHREAPKPPDAPSAWLVGPQPDPIP